MGDVQDEALSPCTGTPESAHAAPDSTTATPEAVPPGRDSGPPTAVTKMPPRPSGLKPPTKIGRLCAHSAPKPAVPMSPRSADGGSSETLRKFSDDYSRKHLADLVEADEEADGSGALVAGRIGRYLRKASTSSTYSVTSMDSLWEKHPRRLSEAGLRRSSEHSVVLTEDTDSFIIGDRVWVGGGKPGQIAYIGETQFAPGEWAGIVLDDPIGKNDGSVAGTRYFQCSERRGVFSRLTRLTRAPLYTPAASVSPHAASPASDAGSVKSAARARRALSPNGSVRSVFSSKMNQSVTAAGGGELRLGERVIVSSSQGSKAGTLRYAGPADFAPGLWCGVELDDPIGKNDGSVEGKRYFECSPRFGLFAPASKVSRSPSNRKPGACLIHSNGRTPLRRSNSRESLTSLGTSIASSMRTASRAGAGAGVRLGGTSPGGAQRSSGPRASSTPVSAKNALQEMLREKQQHLERLMRERELERAEVARLALQAERAEGALLQARKDAAQAASESARLKAEAVAAGKLLEDERQRVEDLTFRSEEDNIHKEDYGKFKQAMEVERAAAEIRVQQLEAEVVLLSATTEAARSSVAAADDKHAQEMEAMTGQHREEIQAAQMLSAELQKLLDEAYALLKEKENEKDSLGKSMSEELARARAESDKALNEAKSKLTIAQTEFDAQLLVLNAKLQMSETKLETEKQNSERLGRDTSQTILELNSKVSQMQAALDDKIHELNKALGASKEQELSLTKELTKLKMEMSAKVLDIEHLSEANQKYEAASKALDTEIATIKEDFTKKINEYEALLNETSQQNDKYSAEVMELQQKLSIKSSEYEKLLNESKDSSLATSKAVEEYKKQVNERDKEIVKLKHNYEEATANFNKSHAIIAEEHKKQIDDRNQQIEKLLKEIEGHQLIIDQHRNDFDALNLKMITNVDEMKVLNDQNGKLNLSVVDLTKTNVELTGKIGAMELEIGELKRQLNSTNEKCAELQNAKEKVESEYLNLTTNSTNSNEEINKLSQYLREAEKELQEARDKFREKSNDHERLEQELRQQLNKVQQEFDVEKEDLIKKLTKTQEDLTKFEDKIKELDGQLLVFKKQIAKQETDYNALLDTKASLENEIQSRKSTETELQSQLEEICKQSERAIQQFKLKVDMLKADGETSELKLKEKVDQLVEAQNDLNNRLEQAQKNEESLQKSLEEFTVQSHNEITVLDKELKQKEIEMIAIREEIIKSTSQGAQINVSIGEKDNIIKELKLKLAMLEVDMKSNIDVIAEKERPVSGEEIAKIIEDKQELEKKLSTSELEMSTLQQKYENIISDKSGTETILKEQQDKYENLVKNVETLSQEKSSFEIKCGEISEQFSKLTIQHHEITKQVEIINETNIQLTNVVKEKENLLKASTENFLLAEANIKNLESEREQLQKVLEEKVNVVSEQEKQLSELQVTLLPSLHLSISESSAQIEQLNKQIENTSKTHKSEIESLQKIIKSFESNSKEKDNKLEELNKSNEKIIELQTQLSKTDEDFKKLTKINNGQKANYEDLNKQLQSEYDKLKKDSKKERHILKDKLQEFEKSLHESKDKINVEISKQAELQIKLVESEKNAQELANKVEILTVHQKNTSTEQDSMLEKLTVELQSVRKTSAEALAANQEIISKLKLDIDNRINDLLKKDDRITKLEEELKNQKAKTEIAQREKHLVQKESATKEKDSIRKENYDNGITKANGPADESALKLLEEKELIEGQVSFLNSVIVDMQRKNEQLLARVQALETGFSPHSPDNNYDFSIKKEVALRLFCDICDVFDAHDTEDCPRQAAEAPAPPPAVASARKPPPPQRPYCDICEVFGHATENCDEEETF